MKSTFLPCLTALVLAAGTGITNAQATNENYETSATNNSDYNTNSTTSNHRGSLSERDYRFVKEATVGGQMEVTLGQLAQQNAQDQAVRDFGARMVRDHQAADQELAQIISQKNAGVSDEPGMMAAHMIKHLQGLKGTEFDTAYIKHMVAEHKKDIKEFQKEAENGEDADVKNFASKTLPTLQDHLRMAEDAQTKLSSSASK
jgi:putative membrane protein